MNERILELAEQAGIWQPTHNHKTWVRGEYISSPGELEKFAELIVEEMYIFMCNATDNDKPRPTFKEVKEHFGVEEK